MTSTPVLGVVATESHDIANKLCEFVQNREAFSDNTWKQQLSVMRIGSRWAEEHQRQFLPMSRADLRDYLLRLRLRLQAAGRASSTISTHAALISMLHRNAGLMSPNHSPLMSVGQDPIVCNIFATLPFCMWHATLLRVSELSRLRVRDISRAADGRIVLDMAWTKTLVMTGGLVKGLGDLSSQRLTEWLTVSGLITEPDAFIFSPVHRTNRAQAETKRPLSTRALKDIFASAWLEARPAQTVQGNKNRYRGWSGHSARVGAAIEMATKKYSIAQIMREGTWKKAETVMRYIRYVDAHAGDMVDLMDLFAQYKR